MRFLLLTTFFVTLVGCAQDPLLDDITGPVAPPPPPPVVTTPTATAIRLTLTPAPITVAGGDSVQLLAAVVWSDSAAHVATITWSATGGTVSPTAWYRAATTAGRFFLVATCTCGLTDSIAATVTTTATPAAPAAVNVSISGLPAGLAADVTLTGPNGYRRALTAGTAIDSLVVGDYVLTAATVVFGSDSYTPSNASQAFTLLAGDHKTVSNAYALAVVTNAGAAHPRVWMNADRVQLLKNQAGANTPRWQRIKTNADGQLARGNSFAGGDEVFLPDLCEAYLATGSVQYAQRAGVILTAYAVEGDNLQQDSGYPYRFWMPLMTAGLDWCYNGLTVAQRHQVATWLMNRADWVWPETDPGRAGAWGMWPSNNYFWGFMMTGPAALAADGDDTGTGAISGANRPAYHRALALTKWNSMAAPFFASDGVGGAWTEGTGYDSSWYVGRFADAFLTAGAPISHPFLEASLNWRMQSTMPGNVFKIPFGDQARVSAASLYAYDRVAALDALSASNASGTLASQVQLWLNQIDNVPTSETETGIVADELLHYDPSVSPASSLAGLPKSYLAAGAGYFVYRNSWTDPTTTAFTFQSGPLTESHQAAADNSLMIWKGNFWISASANIYSASGIEQFTPYYNTLTLGGGATPQTHGQSNTGQILGAQVTDQLVVVRGQAKNAYGSDGNRPVTDFLRTVAYLPQRDAFVVVDRVTTASAALPKTFWWHSQTAPAVLGNSFKLENGIGDYRCFGTVAWPLTATVGSQGWGLGNGGAASSNAVVVSVAGNTSDVVVTVFQCGNAGSAPYVPVVVVNGTQTVVTIGPSTVTVPLNETQQVTSN